MSVEFLPQNPRRPVDWRWHRAVMLASRGRYAHRGTYDDEWVVAARKFKTRLDQASSVDQLTQLAERDPTLFYAHQFYSDGGDVTDGPREEHSDRWELEARLLARQDPLGIAQSLATTVQVVEAYERLFFNVRERIDNVGYILHQVLGPALHRGLQARKYDLLWKWYGYSYGHVMLSALIHQVADPQRPINESQVDEAFRDDGIKSMLQKQAIAARTMPVNSHTQLELLHVYSKFVEIEKIAGESSASGQNTIFSNIQAMLTSLPWAVGKYAHVDEGQFVDYHNDGVELRTEELMSIAVGDSRVLAGLPAPSFPGGDDAENGQGG